MPVLVAWRWAGVIATLSLLACSGSSAGEGGAPTSLTVEGAQRLRGASVSAAPAGAWVVGGAVLSDDTYHAITEMSVVLDPDLVAEAQAGSNDLLVRYRTDGTIREAVRLPLGSRTLLYADVATAHGGAVVAGVTCPRPLGCAPADIRPFAAVVADGEARELDLGIAWPSPSVSIAGVAGTEVVVAAADEDTRVLATGGRVQALAIDPATAAVRPLSLPDGVRFAGSVCARDGRLVAVTPVLTETLSLAGVEVWAGDGQPGSAMQRIGMLDLPPASVSGGPTTCTADVVALAVLGDQARVLLFDTASGSLVANIDTAGRVELMADRDQILFASHDEAGLRLQRWTAQNGLSDMSERLAPERQVLLIDGAAVDATDLLEHVPRGDGPPLEALA